jgi:nitroimidazol reductase NimA-like FMN-containing flavoprotein (pyridoxamine 5'-phosphate oxidase superfamily)
MSLAQETEMSASQIDDFLSDTETGVLSLAMDNEPYSIPISYGYDATSQTFYFRLVSAPGSEKRTFLSSAPNCRLVVYDEDSDGTEYRSVIATGTLEQIDPAEMSVEQIEQYGEARRPLFEIWGAGKEDLDIQLYTLDPAELSGRRTTVDREQE